MPEPPKPHYSLHPTKERLAHQDQSSGDNINNILITMFQEAPNSYQEALNLEDSDKWLAASQEEFDGLTEMGVWKLVDCPNDTDGLMFSNLMADTKQGLLPKDIHKFKG